IAGQLEEMSQASTQDGLAAGFDMRMIELIRLRASQLNGGGSCLKAHTAIALEHGEIHNRTWMLTAWQDTEYFTQAEEAALEIAEIITLIGESGYKDEQYARLAEILSEEQIAAATWIAIVINASNRLWIANNPPVRLPKELRRS